MSNVCAKCFQDKIAQRFIRANGSLGNCDFCDSRNRKVIQAYQLKTLFEEVVSLYERYEPAPGPSSEFSGGESLAECLSEWEIFPEDGDEASQNAILDEIMGFDSRDADICASDEWQSTFENWAAISSRDSESTPEGVQSHQTRSATAISSRAQGNFREDGRQMPYLWWRY